MERPNHPAPPPSASLGLVPRNDPRWPAREVWWWEPIEHPSYGVVHFGWAVGIVPHHEVACEFPAGYTLGNRFEEPLLESTLGHFFSALWPVLVAALDERESDRQPEREA